MKEVFGKSKLIYSTLPRKIGPNLADDIPTAARSFESYFQKTNEAIKDKLIPTIPTNDAFASFLSK